MAILTFPTPPDDLTETAMGSGNYLDSAYGIWWGSPSGSPVNIDTVNKAVGLQSVVSTKGAHHLFESARDVYTPVDTTPFSDIHFWFGCEGAGDPASCYCLLIDSGFRQAYKIFGSPLNSWTEHSIPLSSFDNVEAGFDWSNVISVGVYNPTAITKAWVDDLYFYGEVPEGILNIDSSPRGKTGTISYGGNDYPFTTVSTVSLPVGLQVTITMPAEDFDKWEDESTSNIRTLTIQLGSRTIRAYYTTAIAPLLTINSVDEKGVEFPGENAVQLTYMGISEMRNVPCAHRLTKGTYTLTAMPPGDRSFQKWIKPDGTETTQQYITFDLQDDSETTVVWSRKGFPLGIILIAGSLLMIPLGIILIRKFR